MQTQQPIKPAISVVIPVYGQLHLVMECLVSLAKTTSGLPVQFICVDDATPEFDLMDIPLPISCAVVRQKVNQGFSASCNAGAAHALADIILFLNSDTVAHDNWISPLLATFNDSVGIVGPKLVFPQEFWCQQCRVYGPILCPQHPNDCQQVERIQSCGGWFDAKKGPFHRYFMWRSDDPVVNECESVSWTTGAALAIRKDVFKAAEGFDMGYQRAYFEDVDMCMRVKKAGLSVMYQPQSVFTHKVGQSTGAASDPLQSARRFQANSRRFHTIWDADIVIDTPGVVYVNY